MVASSPSDRTIAVVVNGKSRRGREWFGPLVERLNGEGWKIERAVLATKGRELERQVRQAVRAAVPIVAVGGGDGTFTHVAGLFRDSESVLGVLPFGTGNAFARDLGIASTVEGAVQVLTEGRVGTVDLGLAAGERFLNITTVGLTTRIAEWLQPAAKRRYGRAVYLIALVRAVSVTRPFHCDIETAEGRFEFDSLQVVIGNGRYHAGPFPLHPDASITEGKLHLYALRGRSKAHFLKLAWHLRTGKHVDLAEVFTLETAGGTLRTAPSKRVTVDGEIRFQTPLEFGIEPDALRVMVPKDFAG